MSRFDRADAKLSAAMSRVLNEPVIWRPFRVQEGQHSYTRDRPAAGPDPARPVRSMAAIVTWAPTVTQTVQGGDQTAAGGGTTRSFAVTVDFDLRDFGDGPRPRRGDRLELPEEEPRSRHLEITRLGDDGSARLVCYCTVIRQ